MWRSLETYLNEGNETPIVSINKIQLLKCVEVNQGSYEHRSMMGKVGSPWNVIPFISVP